MATCPNTVEAYIAQNATLDVSEKYIKLMQDTLAEGSLYERVKDTYFELFKNLNISESERLQLVANNISTLTATLSAQAMNTAIAWSKEERDGAFQLAQIKAQTELTLAQKELTIEQICRAQVETALTTAQKDEVLASTLRNDAQSLAQTESIRAQTYAQLADAFRKSGIVKIGSDTDGEIKGLSGDLSGYTHTQDKFLARQEISFEDSKRTHAANASASMIAQLMSAEVPITETDTAFLLWKSSMDYLTTTNP